METGDCLFVNLGLFFSELPYNVQSEEGKGNSGRDIFTQEHIRDPVELCSKVLALRAHEPIFWFWLSLLDSSRYRLIEKKNWKVTSPERVRGVLFKSNCSRWRKSHCTTREHRHIILAFEGQSRTFTPRWLRMQYISRDLIYRTITCWSVLPTKQRGSYPRAICNR